MPAEFFAQVLGPRRKYSSDWWPQGVSDLAEAEAVALAATARHVDLADGQSVLEPACVWGSPTPWMAGRYPASRITAVSKSNSPRGSAATRVACRLCPISTRGLACRCAKDLSSNLQPILRASVGW
ncbi:SAM-dependent methyltransferase [Paraburkholderia mimosarum]|uniref:SAM-dependent methyltransferase n=1 Tax=Paraburkholderia mimosarum TaxID=312026 RepID=UPI003B50E048